MTADYEFRCLSCGTAQPAESLADAEALMALHQAIVHPDQPRKLIRPRAATLQLAVERAER